MATANPFDLLGDDVEDPSQLISTEQLKVVAAPKKEHGKPEPRGGATVSQQSKPAQLSSKPLPSSQAGFESVCEGEGVVSILFGTPYGAVCQCGGV